MKSVVLALAILSTTAASALADTPISINPEGKVCERGTRALLSGTVECPAGYFGDVSISLDQVVRAKKTINHAYGYVGSPQVTCTGSPQTFQVSVTPYDR